MKFRLDTGVHFSLRGEIDSVVSLSNEDLSTVFTGDDKLSDSFSKAHEVWRRLVADVADRPVVVH